MGLFFGGGGERAKRFCANVLYLNLLIQTPVELPHIII